MAPPNFFRGWMSPAFTFFFIIRFVASMLGCPILDTSTLFVFSLRYTKLFVG